MSILFNFCIVLLETKLTRRPRSGAQSGSRIFGGGVGRTNLQLLMLSSNLLKSKIPISGGGEGAGGVGGTNFQLLMLSSNLLKSKIPISGGGGGGGWWNQLSTFDAEFKFAKIQNSHFWGGGGGLVEPTFNF